MPAVMSVEKCLKGKARRRFYEPLVILKALTLSCDTRSVPDTDRTELLIRSQSPEDVFHVFVYKLALACSSHKGGDTVTSIAVMEDHAAITYVIACNNVSKTQGENIANHIRFLLRSVHEIRPDKPAQRDRDEILKKILIFNRKRIECYLKKIVACATDSLGKLLDSDDQPNGISDCFRGLATCASVSNLAKASEADYLASCFTCLESINEMVKTRTSNKTYEDEISSHIGTTIWAELKHSMSRMRAYPMVVQSLLKARKRWPELFENPQVIHIPSSKPDKNPLGKCSEDAEAIIGRMTSDPAEMKVFRDFAQDMRKFNLGERIREECGRSSFKPLIHAEILIHEWISREGSNRNLSYFNDWKHIGCSKPPCLMCKYYFESCGSEVQMRPSHHNLYLNWQFPPSTGPAGSSAARKWQKSLNDMQEKIRQAAFKVMRDKCSPGKDHDSNTYELGSVWSTRFSQSLRHSQQGGVISGELSILEDNGSDSEVGALGTLLGEVLSTPVTQPRLIQDGQ